VDGEDSEGELSGSIISGFVRVGLGNPEGTRGVERTCIFNGYAERIDLAMISDYACQQRQAVVAIMRKLDMAAVFMARSYQRTQPYIRSRHVRRSRYHQANRDHESGDCEVADVQS